MRDHTFFMYRAMKAAHTAEGFNNKNKTGAVIVYRNRIISIGSNSKKTHPLARTYSKHPEAIYLHAEIDAIIKIKDSSILKDSSIYIARKKNNGFCGLSKPCNGCMAAISHFDIAHVNYTIDSDVGISYATFNRRKNQLFVCQEIK